MIDKSYAYAETLDVLDNMNDIYINQIPIKFLEFLKNNASKNYKKHIDKNIELKEQNLSKDTINILALINLKYWVKDEEHKNSLLEIYKENDKYSNTSMDNEIKINELFAKKNEKNIASCEELMVVKKENFIVRIMRKIKSLIIKER